MCKGAKRNVYPSSMCRDMSGGLIAYEFHEGKHATSEDIVPIFNFDDEDIVSPAEQKQHFYLGHNLSDAEFYIITAFNTASPVAPLDAAVKNE